MTNYLPLNAEDIYKNNSELKKNHEKFLDEWYANYYHFRFDTNSRIPIKNHVLIEPAENIKALISEYNTLNNTKYTFRSIDWTFYDGEYLKDFIYSTLDKKQNERSNNENFKN